MKSENKGEDKETKGECWLHMPQLYTVDMYGSTSTYDGNVSSINYDPFSNL